MYVYVCVHSDVEYNTAISIGQWPSDVQMVSAIDLLHKICSSMGQCRGSMNVARNFSLRTLQNALHDLANAVVTCEI